MKQYPLQMLIGIRDRRYQNALNKVHELEDLVKATSLELKNKKQELEDYLIWKDQEINRRFDKIMNKINKKDFYTKFNEEIMSLNYKELKLEEEILEIENKLKKLKEDVKKAKEAAKSAHKSLQKLETHKEIWLVEEHKYEEYQADKELEDFRGKQK